jgi:hypothetical protein
MRLKGSCVFCGAPTAVPVVFPDTFTAYQLLQAGDNACARCHMLFTDPKFRRNCWFMIDTVWAKIDDPLAFLDYILVALKLELAADPRFALEPLLILYLTKKKRKHGWILAVQNPVLNVNRFVLVVDEEKIMFERAKFNEYLKFSKRLLDTHAIPKSILLGGMPKPSDIKRYCLAWPDCFKLRSYQRDSLWRIIVEFSKRS